VIVVDPDVPVFVIVEEVPLPPTVTDPPPVPPLPIVTVIAVFKA
jgi:hypothetical protein